MSNRKLGLLVACALGAAGMVTAPAWSQTTLRVVNHSDLKILDPVWTTAYIVRNHGYMIYDTLFATDGNLEIKPQMVDKWTTSDDKLTWTFTPARWARIPRRHARHIRGRRALPQALVGA